MYISFGINICLLAYHSTEYRQSTKKKQLSRLNSACSWW